MFDVIKGRHWNFVSIFQMIAVYSKVYLTLKMICFCFVIKSKWMIWFLKLILPFITDKECNPEITFH